MQGRGRGIYVPDDVWDEWQRRADELGISTSELVRIAVGRYLETRRAT